MFVFRIKRLSKGEHQTANPPSMPSPGSRPPRDQTLLPGMLMCSGLDGAGWVQGCWAVRGVLERCWALGETQLVPLSTAPVGQSRRDRPRL